MAIADEEQKEGKHDDRFVLPGIERVLCWDCNYYGHRRGHKICPNYDPSKLVHARGQKTQQVNVTAGSNGTSSPTKLAPTNNPGTVAANTEVSSLSRQGGEAGKGHDGAGVQSGQRGWSWQ